MWSLEQAQPSPLFHQNQLHGFLKANPMIAHAVAFNLHGLTKWRPFTKRLIGQKPFRTLFNSISAYRKDKG